MTQATILVADQEAEHLRQLADVLRTAGYVPITVSNSREVKESLSRFKPDIFFVNPMMPDLEELSVPERSKTGKTLPPIVLSVRSQMPPSLRQQYMARFGAHGIVSAPFSSAAVILAVESCQKKPRQPLIQDTTTQGLVSDVDETLSELDSSGPFAGLDKNFDESDTFNALSNLLNEDSQQSKDLSNLSDKFQILTKPKGKSKKFSAISPKEGPPSDATPSSTVRVSNDEVMREMAKIRETLAKGTSPSPANPAPTYPNPSQTPRLRYGGQEKKLKTGLESGALTSSDIFGALINDIESGKVSEKADKPVPTPEPEPERLSKNKKLEPLKPLKPSGPYATQPIPMEDPPSLPAPPKPKQAPEPAETPPENPPSGNQYQLIRKIASGGMAEVWKAKLIGEKGFEKIVAIKKILPHLSDNDEFITMFIDEAKVAANLTHPNIAQIYELGKMGNSFFIAMEHVDGYNLRQILNFCKGLDITFVPEIAVFIGMKLCNALNYAHLKKGYDNQPLKIVHRDVSPQNILISREGEVKLVDFGIAKASIKASQTVAGSLKGKLLYMSPEQAEGKMIDGRSDIFSLASVLYEAITGRKLFAGDSELSVLKNVRQAKFAKPRHVNPNVPVLLESILLKTLSKLPEQRFESAKELEKAFKSYIKQEKLHLTESDVADYLRLIVEKDADGLRAFGQKRSRPASTVAPVAEKAASPQPDSPTLPPDPGKQKSKSWLWILLGFLILAAGGGWFAYQSFSKKNAALQTPANMEQAYSAFHQATSIKDLEQISHPDQDEKSKET